VSPVIDPKRLSKLKDAASIVGAGLAGELDALDQDPKAYQERSSDPAVEALVIKDFALIWTNNSSGGLKAFDLESGLRAGPQCGGPV